MAPDILLAVALGLIFGGPPAIAALWQPTYYPHGYLPISAPDRDDPGTAREVGVPGDSLTDTPTSPPRTEKT